MLRAMLDSICSKESCSSQIKFKPPIAQQLTLLPQTSRPRPRPAPERGDLLRLLLPSRTNAVQTSLPWPRPTKVAQAGTRHSWRRSLPVIERPFAV